MDNWDAVDANDVSQGQDGTATDADAEAVAPVEALPTASDKTDANLESEAHAIYRALHVFIGSTAADMHDVRCAGDMRDARHQRPPSLDPQSTCAYPVVFDHSFQIFEHESLPRAAASVVGRQHAQPF